MFGLWILLTSLTSMQEHLKLSRYFVWTLCDIFKEFVEKQSIFREPRDWLKICLFHCYEVLRLHNTDTICRITPIVFVGKAKCSEIEEDNFLRPFCSISVIFGPKYEWLTFLRLSCFVCLLFLRLGLLKKCVKCVSSCMRHLKELILLSQAVAFCSNSISTTNAIIS